VIGQRLDRPDLVIARPMGFGERWRYIAQSIADRLDARQGGCRMDFKLELVIVPVSDVDRAKSFYIDRAGFTLDVDHRAGEEFRVVQLTPPGSACSIALMRNPDAAGSVRGLHLVVSDIDAARADLAGRGTPVGEIFHFEAGTQVAGPDPERGNYNSFLSFSDPDGNNWLVQEVRRPESSA
jgi:predicted enzyme related to lactoylglutathione lyase